MTVLRHWPRVCPPTPWPARTAPSACARDHRWPRRIRPRVDRAPTPSGRPGQPSPPVAQGENESRFLRHDVRRARTNAGATTSKLVRRLMAMTTVKGDLSRTKRMKSIAPEATGYRDRKARRRKTIEDFGQKRAQVSQGGDAQPVCEQHALDCSQHITSASAPGPPGEDVLTP